MPILERNRDAFPHITAFEENLYHCSSCNHCVDAVWEEWGIDHVCPTLLHHSPAHGYSGKGYIAAARAWFEGTALDPSSLAERAFTCTTCGNCEEVCPIAMKPMQIAVGLRAELIDRGQAPDFALRVRDAIVARDNPRGLPRARRDRWADGLEQDDGATIGVLAGCAAACDLPTEARAALRLLQAAGGARAVEDAPCCGAPLAALGFAREAAERRAALTRHLTEAGIGRVAVVGAECLAALATDSDAEAGPDADGALAAVAAAVADGRLLLAKRTDNPPPARVGYLDPCHLTKKAHGLAARDDAGTARALLGRLGIAIVEPTAAPRFQICCGAAGGMPEAQPDAARRMAEARLGEYAERGAAIVVTASPLCAAHLQSAGGDEPAVRGLFGFLLDHFEATPGSTRA